jgi:osmotically-inducible protein OsmY
MANLLVASRVRAALAAAEETASVDVGVRVEDGVVRLTGSVRPSSTVEPVLRVVGGVEGVREVDRQGLDAPDSSS